LPHKRKFRRLRREIILLAIETEFFRPAVTNHQLALAIGYGTAKSTIDTPVTNCRLIFSRFSIPSGTLSRAGKCRRPVAGILAFTASPKALMVAQGDWYPLLFPEIAHPGNLGTNRDLDVGKYQDFADTGL